MTFQPIPYIATELSETPIASLSVEQLTASSISAGVLKSFSIGSAFIDTPGFNTTRREGYTMTLLQNGTVLAAGGTTNQNTGIAACEIYDPVANTWTSVGSLNHARCYHSAVLLPNGRVLVAGGISSNTLQNVSEIYDPIAQTWSTSGSLTQAKMSGYMVLLNDGTVLFAGGQSSSFGNATSQSQIYAAGTWSTTGSMTFNSLVVSNEQAILLPNGMVLIAGGTSGRGPYQQNDFSVTSQNTASLYNPGTSTWTSSANTMTVPRALHGICSLQNGQVLIAGGIPSGSSATAYSSSEIYDPVADTFTATTGSMTTARCFIPLNTLPNGQVLTMGGGINFRFGRPNTFPYLYSTELYNPTSQTWTASFPLDDPNTEGDYNIETVSLSSGVLAGLGAYNSGLSNPQIYGSLSPVPTIGGGNTQIQYNSNGAFAGDPGLTYSAGILSATGLTVGTGELIMQSGSTLDMQGQPLINVPTPVNPQDATPKVYVDTAAAALAAAISALGISFPAKAVATSPLPSYTNPGWGIQNSGMEVWSNLTSYGTQVPVGMELADHWFLQGTFGSFGGNVSQVADERTGGTGTYSMEFYPVNNFFWGGFYQFLPFQLYAGQSITVSIWARDLHTYGNTNQAWNIHVQDGVTDQTAPINYDGTTNWVNFTFTCTVSASATQLKIWFEGAMNNALHFDDITVTAVQGANQLLLQASSNGALTIDGVSFSEYDRVLITGETGGNQKYNGLYQVYQVGDANDPFVLVRTTSNSIVGSKQVQTPTSYTQPFIQVDPPYISGTVTYVTQGTTNQATGWMLTTPNPIVEDTTALTFTKI